MPITLGSSLSFCGRTLSSQDVSLIRQLSQQFSQLSLTELAATVCELLDWRRPNGGLKTRECFLFLQELRRRGWLAGRPELQQTKPRGPQPVRLDTRSDPAPPLEGPLREFLPGVLERVQGPSERTLFRQYLERYHYLGYRVPYGAHLSYWVRSQKPPQPRLACLLFSSAAWKMGPRDAWIGWSPAARQANLPRLVNHSRPVLLETLVDQTRFRGACYRAANWIHVGLTQGRGRMDRLHEAHGRAPKHIFRYPLQRDWRRQLCGGAGGAVSKGSQGGNASEATGDV